MPAHVIDDLKARAIVDAAEPAVGLSGPKDWRAQQAFLNPYDTESDQRGFALGYPNAQPPIRPQICCCVAALAFLRDAGKDGTLLWRGLTSDILRSPQAGRPGVSPRLVGDSPRLLRALATHHGLLSEPDDDRPDLRAGTIALIGGDDGQPRERWQFGGLTHGLLVAGVREDGTLDIIHGGQGADGTAIERGHLELRRVGKGWWLRAVGAAGDGRRIRWYFQAGELPEVSRG